MRVRWPRRCRCTHDAARVGADDHGAGHHRRTRVVHHQHVDESLHHLHHHRRINRRRGANVSVGPPIDASVNPAVEALSLGAEGIGTAAFGADPDTVISYIGSYLGEPTNDTGWIDPLSVGVCPGTEIRFVDWGTLQLVFGDASQVTEGVRHFFAYYYGSAGEVGGAPVGLVTDAGITTGSRVTDVKAAYPGVTLNPEDDFTSPFFYVSDNLRGYLTGVDDDSTVTVILGGMSCSE